MSHTIAIEEAAEKLAELIEALEPGDEIVLTSHDQPVAKIIPSDTTPQSPIRRAGSCKGMLVIHQDDDEHLNDFAEYMR